MRNKGRDKGTWEQEQMRPHTSITKIELYAWCLKSFPLEALISREWAPGVLCSSTTAGPLWRMGGCHYLAYLGPWSTEPWHWPSSVGEQSCGMQTGCTVRWTRCASILQDLWVSLVTATLTSILCPIVAVSIIRANHHSSVIAVLAKGHHWLNQPDNPASQLYPP